MFSECDRAVCVLQWGQVSDGATVSLFSLKRTRSNGLAFPLFSFSSSGIVLEWPGCQQCCGCLLCLFASDKWTTLNDERLRSLPYSTACPRSRSVVFNLCFFTYHILYSAFEPLTIIWRDLASQTQKLEYFVIFGHVINVGSIWRDNRQTLLKTAILLHSLNCVHLLNKVM